MRNTYHTLPEDTQLFDRLRHRAYAYNASKFTRIVSVRVRPAFTSRYALTSADITYWDVCITYEGVFSHVKYTFVRPSCTRSDLELMYRHTNAKTRYYVRALSDRGCE